jgi:hypothetical protein
VGFAGRKMASFRGIAMFFAAGGNDCKKRELI